MLGDYANPLQCPDDWKKITAVGDRERRTRRHLGRAR
jgi:hypothetical protein